MKTTVTFLLVALFAPVAYAEQWEEVVQRWPDGKPQMVNTLDGDGIGGAVIKRKDYFKSGKLQMEMELKDGKPHGHFIRYYENGNKQWEGYYSPIRGNSADGTKEGVWLCYDRDTGEVNRVITYRRGSRARPDQEPPFDHAPQLGPDPAEG